MFWWFERAGHYLRCEVRFPPTGGGELVVTPPDGAERIEVFSDSEALTTRQDALQRELVEDGWTGPHGWNL